MTKPDIVFETEGDESNGHNRTYALKTNISEINTILPTISPVHTELRRAEKRNMAINSSFATFLDHVTSLDDFIENYDSHQTDYEDFASKYTDKIVNYSLDLTPKSTATPEAVSALRDIQLNANSPFLFEYENDVNQNVDSFTEQLNDAKKWLIENGVSKIVIPVLDMKTVKEHLILEKLNALSSGYNRINVIYASPLKNQSNWSDLKAFLNGNKIWCHMDCVLNRYDSDRIAHRVRLYGMGISSTSIGFPFGGNGSNKKNIYQFNSSTHTYELLERPYTPSFAGARDRAWINSLNEEIKELQNMREQTTRGILYSQYLPSIDRNYLAFSEGI